MANAHSVTTFVVLLKQRCYENILNLEFFGSL
jgi:hypothetical protein